MLGCLGKSQLYRGAGTGLASFLQEVPCFTPEDALTNPLLCLCLGVLHWAEFLSAFSRGSNPTRALQSLGGLEQQDGLHGQHPSAEPVWRPEGLNPCSSQFLFPNCCSSIPAPLNSCSSQSLFLNPCSSIPVPPNPCSSWLGCSVLTQTRSLGAGTSSSLCTRDTHVDLSMQCLVIGGGFMLV